MIAFVFGLIEKGFDLVGQGFDLVFSLIGRAFDLAGELIDLLMDLLFDPSRFNVALDSLAGHLASGMLMLLAIPLGLIFTVLMFIIGCRLGKMIRQRSKGARS